LICTTVDWLGGGGISLEGEKQVVEDNIFAGLRQEIFQISTQPSAIRSAGSKHSIRNNKIGVDSADVEVGVCGRGIYLIGDPKDVLVSGNIIVNPGLSGISLNGALYDANTLRSNTIKQSKSWPQIEGNPEAEDAIQLGPSLPDAFLNFQPAEVTTISGVSVSGTSGAGSPCPNCVVELFLDDTDAVVEVLQSLAVVTADGDGNWTATLPFALSSTQGLRTTSTSTRYNTIANMSAGTTTGLSSLYRSSVKVFLPSVLR
jgi:parallel beta-helix repeat protein